MVSCGFHDRQHDGPGGGSRAPSPPRRTDLRRCSRPGSSPLTNTSKARPSRPSGRRPLSRSYSQPLASWRFTARCTCAANARPDRFGNRNARRRSASSRRRNRWAARQPGARPNASSSEIDLRSPPVAAPPRRCPPSDPSPRHRAPPVRSAASKPKNVPFWRGNLRSRANQPHPQFRGFARVGPLRLPGRPPRTGKPPFPIFTHALVARLRDRWDPAVLELYGILPYINGGRVGV